MRGWEFLFVAVDDCAPAVHPDERKDGAIAPAFLHARRRLTATLDITIRRPLTDNARAFAPRSSSKPANLASPGLRPHGKAERLVQSAQGVAYGFSCQLTAEGTAALGCRRQLAATTSKHRWHRWRVETYSAQRQPRERFTLAAAYTHLPSVEESYKSDP